jgi:carbonic anhydrase
LLTAQAQAAITPGKALEMIGQGNECFVSRMTLARDHRLAQAKQTAAGQFPDAALVSCLDSRILPGLVFDQGPGDLFVARVAGDFGNADILGSLELATALAGAKLIVVMGHTGVWRD